MKKTWIALVLCALLCLSGCSEQGKEAPVLLEPVGVQSDTATVYRGEIYQMDWYDAAVRRTVQKLYFETDGTIARVHAVPGAQVQEGDVLLELDMSAVRERISRLEEELAYKQKNAAYSDALIELDIEMKEIELRQMQAQKADEVQVLLKKNEITQLKAELRQQSVLREPEIAGMEQEVEKLRAQMEMGVLRAPCAGSIVFGVDLAQGGKVSAYETLMCIAPEDGAVIEIDYISESLLNTADALYVQLGPDVYPVRNLPVDAQERMSAALSGDTLRIRFEMVNAEDAENLQSGQYAVIYAVRNYVADALLLPVGAVLGSEENRYVYADEGGERVRRSVKTGVETDSLIEIVEGLEEGAVVYVQD